MIVLFILRSLPNIESIPPKVHLTEVHVVQFLERKQAQGYTDHGCGFWSEQQFESMHSDFAAKLRYRDVGMNNQRRDEVNLDVVLDYNAQHI